MEIRETMGALDARLAQLEVFHCELTEQVMALEKHNEEQNIARAHQRVEN